MLQRAARVGARMRLDIEGPAAERKRLRRSPVVVEVTDADHGEGRRSGVRCDKRKVEVTAVRVEDDARFVDVRGDESGSEKP